MDQLVNVLLTIDKEHTVSHIIILFVLHNTYISIIIIAVHTIIIITSNQLNCSFLCTYILDVGGIHFGFHYLDIFMHGDFMYFL